MTNDHDTRQFPIDFVWGTATAAYQIEGAAREDGRGPSIWDTFSHTPGKTYLGHTGDEADDHYHRVPADVDLLREMGVGAYRFSISWSRVQPRGSGEFNAKGIAFYSDLIDRLRAAGIAPVVTLYHWDLPQALEDDGGWLNRETSYLFADYAREMAHAFGDRVEMWTTLNEPWCAAFLGYVTGVHAPGLTDPAAGLAAAHHLNLAHGLASAAITDVLGAAAKVSITLNLHVTRPEDPESASDQGAVRRIEAIGNRIFLDPLLNGTYPADLLADTAHISDWSFVQAGDLAIIQAPLAVLGINYYSTNRVRGLTNSDDARGEILGSKPDGGGSEDAPDGHGGGAHSPWVGVDDVEFLAQPGPHTAMGWNVEPQGLLDLLIRTGAEFADLPLMVTENGAAFDDVVVPGGRIHDAGRVEYLRDHIEAVGKARDAGVDVRGYFAWSLMDNFEWSFGYSKRFGLIRIDYATQERTWKDSAYWYRSVARTGLLGKPGDIDVG